MTIGSDDCVDVGADLDEDEDDGDREDDEDAAFREMLK